MPKTKHITSDPAFLRKQMENRVARMKQRCLNPKDAAYADYGGRGIRICQRWLSRAAFENDMGLPPSSEYSIDRIDNDGHYSCGKCPECKMNKWPLNAHWATPLEQGNNTRANVRLTKDGKTLTLIGWAKEMGVSGGTLYARHARGYELDKILAPVKKRRQFGRKPRSVGTTQLVDLAVADLVGVE